DDPRKQGLHMPGSRLPIRASSRLAADGISLCLLGLNPDHEGRVLASNRAFLDQGGEFASIYPCSSRALRLDEP
ncbi:MAG: SAM-dependent methyltransferase, partial [Elusimicrobia bacterium]|nr:SAM-dependent methyltransferase [Elusimicrobiota bacterium]